MPAERNAAGFVSLQLVHGVETIAAVASSATALPADFRLAETALAIALWTVQLRAQHKARTCPCPTCQAERRRAMGWRGRLRLRWIGLRSRGRAAWG